MRGLRFVVFERIKIELGSGRIIGWLVLSELKTDGVAGKGKFKGSSVWELRDLYERIEVWGEKVRACG